MPSVYAIQDEEAETHPSAVECVGLDYVKLNVSRNTTNY